MTDPEANPDTKSETPSDSPSEPPSPHEPAWRARLDSAGARTVVNGLLVAVSLAGAFWLGNALGGEDGSDESTRDGHTGHASEDANASVWTCSMHPQIRMDAPGSCPICGMDLIEATDDDDAASGDHAVLSPRAKALARIRTKPVVRTPAVSEVRLLGRVEVDETRERTVTPWTAGRIDKLRVRETGVEIKRGQVVATIYSPEVYAAMRDLVSAVKQAEKLSGGLHGSGTLAADALESARERLRLLGVKDSQIKKIEKSKKPPKRIEIRSSSKGTVLERKVDEGNYVQVGSPLFRVADLSRVWVQIDAYEMDLPHLRVGQDVELTVDSVPDEPFLGTIAFIDPIVDRKTRTAQVRVEVDNPEGKLRPGMFAEAVIDAGADATVAQLVIPASAPLFTGRRSVVYVEDPRAERPTYALRVVRLGPRAGPVYPVLDGLSEGERVVTRGAFVIDADLQLAGKPSMMAVPDDTETGTPQPLPLAPGTLDALRPVADAYLEAQVALAADDLEGTRKALVKIREAAKVVELKGRREVRDAWQAIASTLSVQTAHTEHSDLGALRVSFEHISMQMEHLLQRFGNPTEQNVRVAFCPMAFDSKGASWLQADGELANPYYGAQMLRCGEFKAAVEPRETLASGPTKIESSGTAASGHQH